MLVVSCDPGTKHCAFAVFKNRKLVGYKKVKPTFESIKKFFENINDDFELIIEDQYLHLNPNTLVKLVTVRTMVVTLAKVAGAKNCVIVPPQRWQRTILGTHIKAKREQRKRVSLMIASDVAKKAIKDMDVADAICIGEYRLKTAGWH